MTQLHRNTEQLPLCIKAVNFMLLSMFYLLIFNQNLSSTLGMVNITNIISPNCCSVVILIVIPLMNADYVDHS